MSVFGWGGNEYQQLGFENENDDTEVTLPTIVPLSTSIDRVCTGWNHTLFFTSYGRVYTTGSNESGQLAIPNRSVVHKPELIPSDEVIVNGSCGQDFTVLISKSQELFTFGDNKKGQLGLASEIESTNKPSKIKGLYSVVEVSCGAQHTLALTTFGTISAWGSNDHGQVGIDSRSARCNEPQLIRALLHVPITQVCAGGAHSFALSVSGSLFSWGSNSAGQLGLGDQQDRLVPTRVKSLSQKGVRYIACGEQFSAALTAQGRVYTFGCGSSGQLGHNDFNDQLAPRMVVDLMGTVITQICCGRKHLLAYNRDTNKLYACGLNVKGQLGNRSLQKSNGPTVVCARWEENEQNIKNINSEEQNRSAYYFEEAYNEHIRSFGEEPPGNRTVYNVFAGGLQSFALISSYNKTKPPLSYSLLRSFPLYHLSQENTEEVLKDFQNGNRKRLLQIFMNQACINASFLKRRIHDTISTEEHGVHLFQMRASLVAICNFEAVKTELLSAVKQHLIPSLSTRIASVEGLRVYLLVPELLFFRDPQCMWSVTLPFVNNLAALPDRAHTILSKWWSNYPPSFFENMIQVLKDCVVKLLKPNEQQSIFMVHSAIKSSMTVLDLLNSVNEEAKIVDYSTFYIKELEKLITIEEDYIRHLKNSEDFTFCKYPFAMDVKLKAIIVRVDSELQKSMVVHQTHQHNIATIFMNGDSSMTVNPFLTLSVRRTHILADTLRQISMYPSDEYKKPLKVKFKGEEAEDAGGVKKEFFLIVMREMLDPKYGMFEFFKETQAIWFKRKYFEDLDMYQLIGVICGLAIYNSIIIDFPFPLCLYKKLLGKKLDMDDFRGVQTDVARNLQYLLDYDGEDFNDVFDMNFQVVEECFGEITNVNIVPDGDAMQVTQQNKEGYVNAYIDYMLDTSVREQFEAFATGFLKVCGQRLLRIFRPHELMEMVVGCQDYDCNDLEKAAEYKGEYSRNHPLIKNFWTVFHEFDLQMKKKFLAFLTGSDKVSIFGIQKMQFIIQPVPGGDHGDHLPVAHTCFNLLDLPKYPTLNIMRTKLHQAVQNYEGFGLV